MNILPEVSFGIGAALLTAAVAIPRSIIRKRRSREGFGPIVPVGTDQNMNETGISEQGELEEVHPISSPAEVLESTPVEAATGFASFPNSATEQEYRGFKICLNEKKPGLWIAIIMRPDARRKKPQQKTAETWITQEFYQESAALADARVFIDKWAYRKTGSVGEMPEGTLRGMGSLARMNEQLRMQH